MLNINAYDEIRKAGLKPNQEHSIYLYLREYLLDLLEKHDKVFLSSKYPDDYEDRTDLDKTIVLLTLLNPDRIITEDFSRKFRILSRSMLTQNRLLPVDSYKLLTCHRIGEEGTLFLKNPIRTKMVSRSVVPKTPFYSVPIKNISPELVDKDILPNKVFHTHEYFGIKLEDHTNKLDNVKSILHEALYCLNYSSPEIDDFISYNELLIFEDSQGIVRIGALLEWEHECVFEYKVPYPGDRFCILNINYDIYEFFSKPEGLNPDSMFMTEYSLQTNRTSREFKNSAFFFLNSKIYNHSHNSHKRLEIPKKKIVIDNNFDLNGIYDLSLNVNNVRILSRGEELLTKLKEGGIYESED